LLKLLLFDIDGTLVRTAGAGRRSMDRAFEMVYGFQDGFQDIEMMGRTDPSILKESLENHQIVWNVEEVERFREIYFRILEEEIDLPRPGMRLCPGIQILLDSLVNRTEFILGLLTGNWRTSAYIKLRHFGIDGYFTVGAFADDSALRKDLVPSALGRLKRDRGIEVAMEEVYVIGDTPLDIQCAKPHGVRTVGVATGFHSLEEIASENPDFIFRDFQDTEKVLEIFKVHP
jgi:phosphoglycolate phosphatase